MNPSSSLFRIALLLTLVLCIVSGREGRGEASHHEVVVVYNSSDVESRTIAEQYAKFRGISSDFLLGLPLPGDESVSREVYQSRIEEPIRLFLSDRELVSISAEKLADGSGRPELTGDYKIRYLVLCRGIPYKILNQSGVIGEGAAARLKGGMRRNEACVDNELAVLPLRVIQPAINGNIGNPVYQESDPDAIHPLQGVLMVGRLDGPDLKTCLGLIEKVRNAEKRGLWGRVYIDHRGIENGRYWLGDRWMKNAIEASWERGLWVEVEGTESLFPSEYLMSDALFYSGWYAGNPVGAFKSGGVEFVDGAIAYHLHSFSGSNIRDGEKRWVGPLLKAGASVVLGTVHEPYLEFTPNVGVFWDRLLSGFTVGEAAYASMNSLSWQTILIGDPMYRPFPREPRKLSGDITERDPEPAGYALIASVLSKLHRENEAGEANLKNSTILEHLTQHPEFSTTIRSSATLNEYLAGLYSSGLETETVLEYYQRALQLSHSPFQKKKLALSYANIQRVVGDGRSAMKAYQFILSRYKDLAQRNQILKWLKDLTSVHGDERDTLLYRRFSSESP